MGGNAMNDDGHFIDDPLMVVNTKPDFEGLGLPPQEIKEIKELLDKE
jgi:hypothetical protein